MTLSDRVRAEDPAKVPTLGRPQELPRAVEEALVKCLEVCAEFNYPMRKRNLQDLVQNYCVENSVLTRWKNCRPAKDWVRSFRGRWSHRVKIRKPTNIRRSRAKVSPEEVTAFINRIRPNLEGALDIISSTTTRAPSGTTPQPSQPSLLPTQGTARRYKTTVRRPSQLCFAAVLLGTSFHQ
jgi:hypothetical protein